MCREEGDGDMFHTKKSISETSEAAKRRKFGGTERRSFSWIAHKVEWNKWNRQGQAGTLHRASQAMPRFWGFIRRAWEVIEGIEAEENIIISLPYITFKTTLDGRYYYNVCPYISLIH